MDRFLMRLHMGYPEGEDELAILRTARTSYDAIELNPVVSGAEIKAMQATAAQVYIEDSVLEYILKLVTATRTEAEFKSGISVRGGLALRVAAQARALVNGRDFVMPDDVVELVTPVWSHRLAPLRPSGDAMEERRVVTSLLKRIVGAIALPV